LLARRGRCGIKTKGVEPVLNTSENIFIAKQDPITNKFSMAFADKRIAVIGGGLGGMAFINSAIYAGLENIHLYEAAQEFTEVVGCNVQSYINKKI
jgi:cell division GTPase FtsZ